MSARAATAFWLRPVSGLDPSSWRRRRFLLTATVMAIVPLYLAMAVAAGQAHNRVPAAVEAAVAVGLLLAALGAGALFGLGRACDAVALVTTLAIAGGASVAMLEVHPTRAAVALLGGALGVMYVGLQAPRRAAVKAAVGHLGLVGVVALAHPTLPASSFLVPAFALVLVSVMAVAGAAVREANERHLAALERSERLTVPLANVVAHLDYLEAQLRSALPLTSDAELQELLEKLSVEGRSLLGAVQEWVALAHVGDAAHVAEVEVREVLDRVLNGLPTVLADRGLTVRAEGAGRARVWAVESLLGQVLLHLLLHAAAAREAGVRQLGVRISQLDDATVVVAAGPPGVEVGPEVVPEQLTDECVCHAMARSLGAACHTFAVPGGRRYELRLRRAGQAAAPRLG